MLQNLLYFLIISIFCIAWGRLGLCIGLPKNRTNELSSTECLLLSFFAGLALISVISSWMSLFLPVRFWFLFLLTIPVILLEFFGKKGLKSIDIKKVKKLNTLDILFILTVLALFFVLSAGRVVLTDTDLYHLQTIQWIHEFGTVKGIANLYLRYGFYSNWFHLISIFQLPFQHQNFTYLNNTFNIWLFLFFFYQYKKFSLNPKPASQHFSAFYFFVILYMLFEWDLFRVSSSSTTYDFIVTGTTLICIHLLLQKFLFKESSPVLDRVFLLLAITMPFYKLTGFLIAGIWVIFLLYSSTKKRLLFSSLLIGVVGFIPYVYKNYLQTGYPFYPYTIANYKSPAWQVPGPMVDNFNKYIYLNNHYINRGAPNFPDTDFSGFSYFTDWFRYLVREDQLLLILCLIALPYFFYIIYRKYKEHRALLLLVMAACLVAITFWLFTSPDLRFAFGFLIFISFFPLTAFIYPYLTKNVLSLVKVGALSCCIIYMAKKSKDYLSIENIIHPINISKTSYQTIYLNGMEFHIPDQPIQNLRRCLDTPIPCIYQMNPYLEPLGGQLRDGFKMKPGQSKAFVDNYEY